MKTKIYEELKRLAKRYKKYGVTLDLLKQVYKSGIDNGMSEKASLIGVRLGLSHKFKEHDYFTAADIALVTGQTEEEVNKFVESNEDELLKMGAIVEVSSPFFN